MDAPTYPVLPLKDTVVYPEIVHHLAVGRRKSLAALTAGAEKDRELIVVAQKRSDIQDPALDDLHKIGTIVKISRVEKHDQGAQVVVQGLRRVRLEQASANTDYLATTFTEFPQMTLDNLGDDAPAVDALLRENQQAAQQIANLLDTENGDQIYHQLVGSITNPITQMYRIASLANLSVEQRQSVLDASTTLDLMNALHEILLHELQVTELRRQIAEQARGDLDQQQREHVLRQQKRAIEHALGEGA
jgi:ATP-dependent Lon protease